MIGCASWQEPEPGLEWWAPHDLLEAFHPADDCGFAGHDCSGRWHILEVARRESRYDPARTSIDVNGWVRPIPWMWATNPRKWGDLRVRQIIDGHNRVAAAIELGLAIPTVEVTTSAAIADDSGNWGPADPIPSTTLSAMYESSQQNYPHPWVS